MGEQLSQQEQNKTTFEKLFNRPKIKKLCQLKDRLIVDYHEHPDVLVNKFKCLVVSFVQFEKFCKSCHFRELKKSIYLQYQVDFKKTDFEHIQSILKKESLHFGIQLNLSPQETFEDLENEFTIFVNRDVLNLWQKKMQVVRTENLMAVSKARIEGAIQSQLNTQNEVYDIGVSTEQKLEEFAYLGENYLVLLERMKSEECVNLFKNMLYNQIDAEIKQKNRKEDNRVQN